MTNVGIVSTGVYLPDERMTGEEIAKRSGVPVEVVREKMGIREKPIPGPDDHTVAMGVRAAEKAFEACDVKPGDIDLIVYIGEEHKEYLLWTASIKMQQDLGCTNAWGFDVALRCGTTIMAMKVVKDMMTADPSIQTALLAGGYRNVDFIHYDNPRTRFMYNLGAGGAAMILQRDADENLIHGSHLMTDGSFSEDVMVVGGGTKQPMSAEVLDQGLYQLDVHDSEGMKQRLEEKSMANFLEVIHRALEKSGYTAKDIDYLAILHMKKSAHDYVLQELGLSSEQSIYLEDYGHIGQMDQILSLELARQQGKVKEGDLVVFVSAGIGYAWGATVIEWGRGGVLKND